MPSPSSKAPGGAHPLVSVEGGRLVVHEHAAAVLSSAAFRAPLAVLAVTGSARCGKSFLLNQLLGRADGFPTSAGVRTCTRGLWVWLAPLPLAGGGSVLLVDCEALHGGGEAVEEGCLFSIVAALSSMVLFNSSGAIDEGALRLLSALFAQDEHSPLAADDGAAAPFLFWVLRDFSLALRDAHGRPLSAREYLEAALGAAAPRGGARPPVALADERRGASVLRLGALVGALLPRRDCAVLSHPLKGGGASEQLRPRFVQQLVALRERIFSQLAPKRLGGAPLDGAAFVAALRACCEWMNDEFLRRGVRPTVQRTAMAAAAAAARAAAARPSLAVVAPDDEAEEATATGAPPAATAFSVPTVVGSPERAAGELDAEARRAAAVTAALERAAAEREAAEAAAAAAKREAEEAAAAAAAREAALEAELRLGREREAAAAAAAEAAAALRAELEAAAAALEAEIDALREELDAERARAREAAAEAARVRGSLEDDLRRAAEAAAEERAAAERALAAAAEENRLREGELIERARAAGVREAAAAARARDGEQMADDCRARIRELEAVAASLRADVQTEQGRVRDLEASSASERRRSRGEADEHRERMVEGKLLNVLRSAQLVRCAGALQRWRWGASAAAALQKVRAHHALCRLMLLRRLVHERHVHDAGCAWYALVKWHAVVLTAR